MKKSTLLAAAILASSVSASQAASAAVYTPGSPHFRTGIVRNEMKAPASANTRADSQSIVYSYGGETATAYSLEGTQTGDSILLGIGIMPETLKNYKGCKITSLVYTSGTNQNQTLSGVNNIVIRIFTDLNEPPVYEQRAQVTNKAFNTETIELDTPYELTELSEPLIISYSFRMPPSSYWYIPVDKIPNSELYSGLSAVKKKGAATLPKSDDWYSFASEIGALSLGVTIAGDGLPQNKVIVSNITIPEYTAKDSKITLLTNVKNIGANAISSLEFSVDGPADAVQTVAVNFETPVVNNTMEPCELKDILVTKLGNDVPVNLKLTKINGIDNTDADSPVFNGTLAVGSQSFQRRLLVEEATGTWCGYCPPGIVQLAWLNETYPETVISIAAHSGDQMQCRSYNNVLNKIANGSYPNLMINRAERMSPGMSLEPWRAMFNEYYNTVMLSPAYCDIELSGTVSDDYNSVTVNSTTTFGIDATKHLLAFAIVEDNVGPYAQNNNYSGGGHGSMGGWESKPNPCTTYFNDVARYLSSAVGNTGSLPSEIKADEPNQFSITIPLTPVTGGEFHVVGMVINTANGQIVNCAKKSFIRAAVDNIGSDNRNVTVSSGAGYITVTGAENAAVYTLAGAKVADGSADGLAAGVYVVLADGKSYKVLVK